MKCQLKTRAKLGQRVVATGGTFDVLHAGHKRLLARAFEVGDFVFVGVTSDRLVSKLQKTHRVRPFAARFKDVRAFIRSQGWLPRARLVKLNNPFGPAAKRKRLDGLVVSEETSPNGAKLNHLRRVNGLAPVPVYVVKVLKAQDGLPITSTRIRRREIDPNGRLVRRKRRVSRK